MKARPVDPMNPTDSIDTVDSMDILWRKSSFSTNTGNCIELAVHEGEVLVRESDDPEVVVRTTREKLRAFLAGAKAGEFDDLV
jgi:hypothetical protein